MTKFLSKVSLLLAACFCVNAYALDIEEHDTWRSVKCYPSDAVDACVNAFDSEFASQLRNGVSWKGFFLKFVAGGKIHLYQSNVYVGEYSAQLYDGSTVRSRGSIGNYLVLQASIRVIASGVSIFISRSDVVYQIPGKVVTVCVDGVCEKISSN